MQITLNGYKIDVPTSYYPDFYVTPSQTTLLYGQVGYLFYVGTWNGGVSVRNQTVSNGVVSDWSVFGSYTEAGGTNHTIFKYTFTPNTDFLGTGGVRVDPNGISSTSYSSTYNSSSDNALFSINTIRPTVIISSNNSSLEPGESAQISFTVSSSTADFSLSDVTVLNGNLSNFIGSGQIYTATFTAQELISLNQITSNISVDSSKFTDSVSGNPNKSATLAMTVYSVTPEISIVGLAQQNSVLTADLNVSPDGVIVEWYADGSNTKLGEGLSYQLGSSDVGAKIKAVAHFTNYNGVAEEYSATLTDLVSNVNDAPSGAVTVTGTATQGQTLTASNTLADADGLGTISYQWKADGVSISGATSSNYTLAQGQVGKAISVTASYTDVQGTAEAVSSSATSAVAGAGGGLTNGGTTTGNAKVTEVVVQQTDLGIYKLSNGYYAIDESGLSVADSTASPITLKTVANKALAFKLVPSAVLAYSDTTFGVVSGSGTAWTEQKFTAQGVVSGSATKLTLSDVLAKETQFQEDINGGGIGDRVDQVFDNGADEHDGYGLYKTVSGAYVIDAEGLSRTDAMEQPISLKVGVKAFVPKAAPNALLVYEDGTFGVVSGSGTAWTEQKFTAQGVASGSATKLTLSDVLAKEAQFQEDINGGGIGDRVDQMFDNGADEHDGYGLYKTVSGAYVIDAEGLSRTDAMEQPISLKVGVKAFVPKAAPNALLVYEDGTFGVVSGSGTAWTEQKFNESGLASGALIKLKLSDVLAKETQFQEDINGGGIGDRIALVLDGDGYADSVSPFGLYKTVSGSYVLDESGKSVADGVSQDSHVVLAAGKAWAPKGNVVGIAEKDSGYLEVLLKSGAAYTTQKVNTETGLLEGAAAKLKAADQLLAREYYYDMDLNGDQQVSMVGLDSPPTDWSL